MKSVTIVGASLAGHASARALREHGFEGRITIVGGEEHRPYDRPPLSKDFLAGTTGADELWLEAEDENLEADWLLGARAIRLDPTDHRVTLANGTTVASDAVVIATGSIAKTFELMPKGVHTLRTLDDAIALKSELLPGARLVVVGSGFIGLEVASTARDLGLDVVVLGSSVKPLAGIFGDEVGTAVQRLQERHGIIIRNNTVVAAVVGVEQVTGVRLSTGEVVPADVVLLGIGSIPAVDWLHGSGLDLRGGLACDEVGAAAPGVFGVGDCAAWFDPVRGTQHRIGHWSDSRDRSSFAMSALLSPGDARRALRPSYLWSDQCGTRIQFSGRLLGGENVAIEAGGVETGDLLMVYRRADEPVAVVGINQTKLVAQWRKRLASTSSAHPSDLSSQTLTA